MNNRLLELGKKNGKDGDAVVLSIDPEATDPHTLFKGEVEKIEADIERLIQMTGKIREEHQNVLNLTVPEERAAHREDAMRLEGEVRALVGEVRRKLKIMRDRVDDLEQQEPGAATRMKRAQCDRLSRRMIQVTSDFQAMQAESKDEYRKKVQRQAKIYYSDTDSLTDEKIEEMVSTGTTTYAQALASDAKLASAFEDIRERREEIQRIEANIQEVARLFQELWDLVQLQGEVVDSIEAQVNDTSENASRAVKEVDKAEKGRRRARRRELCCIGLILLFLIIFFGDLIF